MKNVLISIFSTSFLFLLSIHAYSQGAAKGFLQGFNEIYLNTAPIEMFIRDTRLGSATGFFLRVPEVGKTYLITNRHVVIDEKELRFPDRLRLLLHLDRADLRRNAYYDVALYSDLEKKQKQWSEVNPSIDVVSIELSNETLKKFQINAFTPKDFAPADTQLALGEPVAIIGYPTGFSDHVHNLPVARQGAVASAFPIPFKGQRHFLVDAILHPGTSGSPVITRPDATRLTTSGERVIGPRVYLVGINSGSYGVLNLNAVWFTNVIAEVVK